MSRKAASQGRVLTFPQKTIVNLAIWRNTMKALGFELSKNSVTQQIEINGKPITDAEEARIRLRFREYDEQFRKPTDFSSRARVNDAIQVLALEREYHPVKKYLEFCQDIYESSDKIDWYSRLIACLGSENKEVLDIFLKKWLSGCCARVFADFQNYCLIFCGSQGIGKSSFFQWLFNGIKSYYPDSPASYLQEGELDPHSKDHADLLATKWCWEIGEVGSTMARRDRNALKEFLTRSEVSQRSAYARYATTRPRICSFAASSNDEYFLSDPTGNRRFLVVNLLSIDWAYSSESSEHLGRYVDRDLLWGQIMSLYVSGEFTPDLNLAEKELQSKTNEKHEQIDPLETWLQENYVKGPYFTSSHDILGKALEHKLLTTIKRSESMRLSEIANKLDWERWREDAYRGVRGYKVRWKSP